MEEYKRIDAMFQTILAEAWKASTYPAIPNLIWTTLENAYFELSDLVDNEMLCICLRSTSEDDVNELLNHLQQTHPSDMMNVIHANLRYVLTSMFLNHQTSNLISIQEKAKDVQAIVKHLSEEFVTQIQGDDAGQ